MCRPEKVWYFVSHMGLWSSMEEVNLFTRHISRAVNHCASSWLWTFIFLFRVQLACPPPSECEHGARDINTQTWDVLHLRWENFQTSISGFPGRAVLNIVKGPHFDFPALQQLIELQTGQGLGSMNSKPDESVENTNAQGLGITKFGLNNVYFQRYLRVLMDIYVLRLLAMFNFLFFFVHKGSHFCLPIFSRWQKKPGWNLFVVNRFWFFQWTALWMQNPMWTVARDHTWMFLKNMNSQVKEKYLMQTVHEWTFTSQQASLKLTKLGTIPHTYWFICWTLFPKEKHVQNFKHKTLQFSFCICRPLSIEKAEDTFNNNPMSESGQGGDAASKHAHLWIGRYMIQFLFKVASAQTCIDGQHCKFVQWSCQGGERASGMMDSLTTAPACATCINFPRLKGHFKGVGHCVICSFHILTDAKFSDDPNWEDVLCLGPSCQEMKPGCSVSRSSSTETGLRNVTITKYSFFQFITKSWWKFLSILGHLQTEQKQMLLLLNKFRWPAFFPSVDKLVKCVPRKIHGVNFFLECCSLDPTGGWRGTGHLLRKWGGKNQQDLKCWHRCTSFPLQSWTCIKFSSTFAWTSKLNKKCFQALICSCNIWFRKTMDTKSAAKGVDHTGHHTTWCCFQYLFFNFQRRWTFLSLRTLTQSQLVLLS